MQKLGCLHASDLFCGHCFLLFTEIGLCVAVDLACCICGKQDHDVAQRSLHALICLGVIRLTIQQATVALHISVRADFPLTSIAR